MSVYFYLRIVVMMYMTPADRPAARSTIPLAASHRARRVGGRAVFYLGLLPARVIEWASASIATIF